MRHTNFPGIADFNDRLGEVRIPEVGADAGDDGEDFTDETGARGYVDGALGFVDALGEIDNFAVGIRCQDSIDCWAIVMLI